MPQNGREREFGHVIKHVIALTFFFEMPRNRWILFSVTFSFHKTSHVLFLEITPYSRFEIFEMPHFLI